jgi:hypothetical protein
MRSIGSGAQAHNAVPIRAHEDSRSWGALLDEDEGIVVVQGDRRVVDYTVSHH